MIQFMVWPEHKLSLSYWNSTTGDGYWLKNCLLDSLLVQQTPEVFTSSGSESLNSQASPVQEMLLARNCLLDSLLVQQTSVFTSSGSESLNSQASPVQEMKEEQVLSVRSSSRNCHSWMGPEPYTHKGRLS
jgi:hypothetical protein